MINRIAQEVIAGYFTILDVPSEVVVGEDIIVTVEFYAHNPDTGVSFWNPWKTFVIVDDPQLENMPRELDATREISQTVQREHTYNLGPMPNNNIVISFYLFAHDDASYDWDWDEFNDWMAGYPIEVLHLNSNYRFVSPIEAPEEPPEEPPEEVMLSGVITSVSPTEFVFGNPIDLIINFNAYIESLYYQARGWETRLVAELDGLSDSDTQWHWGRDGSRTGETLNLGAMPDRNLSGTLILQGRGKAIPAKPWEELNRISITALVSEAPPNGEEQHFTGQITNVIKAPESSALDVILLISWTASADWVNYLGWETKITVSGMGIEFDRQNHIGFDGSRTDQPLELGGWSPGTYTITIKLEAKGILGQWVMLDQITRTVIVQEEEPPDGEEPPEEAKFPWGAVALIGGGAALMLVVAKPKKK